MIVEFYTPRNIDCMMVILVGQSKDTKLTLNPAGFKDHVFEANVGDSDLAFDQRSIDAQCTGLSVV
jgi:hypothetical protein